MCDPIFGAAAAPGMFFGDYAQCDAVRKIAQGYGAPTAQAPSQAVAAVERARLVLQRAAACKLLQNADSPDEAWVSP